MTEGRVLGRRLLNGSAPGFRAGLNYIGLRTARYSYMRYIDGEEELYDLRRDPNEFRSVAHDRAYRGVRAELHRLWRKYRDCAQSGCRAALPVALRAPPRQERQLTQHYWAAVHEKYGGHRGDRR